MSVTIDAKGRAIGRVASEAAKILIGKHKTDFARNKLVGENVEILNAGLVKVTEKKLIQKIYTSYSGYPGGLKKETLKKVRDVKGMKEAVKNAVWGMLPKNKLRAQMIKKLTISE